MKNVNQLYSSKETQNVVKSLARKISGNDKYLENDLAQESYLILHEAAKYFDPQRGVTFACFAYKVLRHALPKVKRIITQVLSVDEQDVTDSLETASFVSDNNPTPSEKYELYDSKQVVRKAVNRLPHKECIAVSLNYGLDGLYERPITYVAEELGCSVEGARKTLDRGVNKLRDMFDGMDYRLCA